VLEVRQLPAGHGVGYGATYQTKKSTRVAVLPVGFVDGVQMEPVLRPAHFIEALKGTIKLWLRFLRISPIAFKVFFDENSAQVIGKIGMQLTMVDVTDLPQVQVGSIARVPLRRTAPGKDIPRIYLDSENFS
jgi:alanine racemase